MTIKQTILSLLAVSTVVSGVIVALDKPDKLTYDEGVLLREVYNYEIQQQGGSVTFKNDENALENLHDILLKREIKTPTIIRGEELSPEDYEILRSGIFLKAEQKTLIERIIE